MRDLFTDKFNSMWHFVFGVLSVFFPLILPLFVIYQYKDINEKNLRIDLSEFFVGFILCVSLIKLKVIPEFTV
jgi:hypothetical protein